MGLLLSGLGGPGAGRSLPPPANRMGMMIEPMTLRTSTFAQERAGWRYRGIVGRGVAPKETGEFEGQQLLVVCGGRCVWEDIALFVRSPAIASAQRQLLEWTRVEGQDVMAINDVGMYLHCEVDHWASLHSEIMVKERDIRNLRILPGKARTHSWRPAQGVQTVWPIENTGGLSGLFGVKVGLLLGYETIVLAGCPMDASGKFFEGAGVGGGHGDKGGLDAWRDAIAGNAEIRNRVRPLSGWMTGHLAPWDRRMERLDRD